MDIESINSDVKTAFLTILSINEKDQEKEISRLYDVDCRLENSYLILQGREGEWFRETREIVWLERKGKERLIALVLAGRNHQELWDAVEK